jgi:hemoglobin-like flavoprotein
MQTITIIGLDIANSDLSGKPRFVSFSQKSLFARLQTQPLFPILKSCGSAAGPIWAVPISSGKPNRWRIAMTPKQVALVQDSFAKVALTSEAAAMLFYNRLFDIAPQMRAMFPDDMIEQRRKLIAMLAAVVKGLGNLEQVLPAASALAKRHVSYGVKAEHYPVVGDALLWTLEKGLRDRWTPQVADAWGTVYGTLSGYMISEAYGRSQAAE